MRPTSNWLEAHARFKPNAEALFDVDTDQRWTYASLHGDSLRWAGRLHNAGVRQGDRVAVLAANRGETFALLFACAELGAILFPMNWRLANEELHWQLGNAEPRVLLVDATHAGRVNPALAIGAHLDLTVLALDDGPGDARYQGGEAPLDAPWVLMYTSGSSGRPKGALLTHQQLHWNAVNTTLACNLLHDSTTLTFTPLFHTGGLNCLSTPMLHRGGRVVLMSGFDAAQATALIARERVTHLMGVPTIYQLLADHAGFMDADYSSVRDAICGGAPLSSPLLERWLDRDIPLRQGFGMTEVGPNCFSMPPERVRDKLGTVGLPIHHVAARVVRTDGSDCDDDEPGELWLSGPAVFGGYLRSPEATDAALVDGWFRTGDVLSRDAEGFYTVRGRLKEMYISGGENVYPAEVEGVIARCPGVGQVAVLGVPDARWGEVGYAFVEPSPGATLSDEAVRAFLDDKLAKFKRPKVIAVHDALPRTATGKLDKPALRRSLETR